MDEEKREIVLCIGSKNPSKIKGITEAFSRFYIVKQIKEKSVNTGIPPQPIGLDQIIEGARRRAELSMDEECDYSVGLEAGFYIVNNEPFDVEVAYVLSRRTREYSIGFSPSFPIPPGIYEGVVRGIYRELEEAVEKIFRTQGIGDREGFIGLLTRRVCDRWILSYYATLMALVKFLNKNLYEGGIQR